MNKKDLRLWRVDLVHRNGYFAPYQLIEAESLKNVHKIIKQKRFRLLDFPNSWSYRITLENRVKVNNKWYNLGA